MTVSVYSLPERAEVTFVATRHETGDELEALGEGCRVAVAEAYRRMASVFNGNAHAGRVFNDTEFAEGRSEGLQVAMERLLREADELDPEGATK